MPYVFFGGRQGVPGGIPLKVGGRAGRFSANVRRGARKRRDATAPVGERAVPDNEATSAVAHEQGNKPESRYSFPRRRTCAIIHPHHGEPDLGDGKHDSIIPRGE